MGMVSYLYDDTVIVNTHFGQYEPVCMDSTSLRRLSSALWSCRHSYVLARFHTGGSHEAKSWWKIKVREHEVLGDPLSP